MDFYVKVRQWQTASATAAPSYYFCHFAQHGYQVARGAIAPQHPKEYNITCNSSKHGSMLQTILQNRKEKRTMFRFRLLILIFLAVVALSSCASSTTPASTPTPTPTASAQGGTFTPTPTGTASPPPTSVSSGKASPTPGGTGAVEATVTSFYKAFEAQNYTLAYSYLDANATTLDGQKLTQQTFTQLTQARDNQYGPLISFDLLINSTDPTQVIMTNSRKKGLLYHAHLQLKQEGNTWKILTLDVI